MNQPILPLFYHFYAIHQPASCLPSLFEHEFHDNDRLSLLALLLAHDANSFQDIKYRLVIFIFGK